MILSLLSNLLGQNQQKNAQDAAIESGRLAEEQQNASNMRQNINQARQNIDLSVLQNKQNTSNPILDDIMKKYGAGRYSK